MRIQNNVRALNAWRNLQGVTQRMDKQIEQLSSGYRVNRAADDVAGLAISERMRSSIGSLRQSLRNIQDGISVAQVIDGSLHEVSALLQRGRELSVQAANGTLTPEDRQSIQTAMNGVLAEVQRIAATTGFNGRQLINTGDARQEELIKSLQTVWLRQAETLIATEYGLTADNVSLKIIFDESGTNPAFVWGNGATKLDNLELHINMSFFQNVSLPNGGAPTFYLDRVVAHELTHAVMARTMNFVALPTWFKEGAAEFIPGAEDRVAAHLAGGMTAADIVNEIDTWEGDSEDYASAYAAVRFLHNAVTTGGGMRDVMTLLAAGQTLDAAINTATGGTYANEAALIAAYKAGGGSALITGGMNLADADVGAIGGGTAETVMDDTPIPGDPLANFAEIWPDITRTDYNPVGPLQVGIYDGHTIDMPEVKVSLYELNLLNVDLLDNASAAIDKFDTAIGRLTSQRSQVGAVQNRLEHSYNVAAQQLEGMVSSESRIRDLDMAQAMVSYAKEQILIQASSAMLAQANSLMAGNMRTLLQNM